VAEKEDGYITRIVDGAEALEESGRRVSDELESGCTGNILKPNATEIHLVKIIESISERLRVADNELRRLCVQAEDDRQLAADWEETAKRVEGERDEQRARADRLAARLRWHLVGGAHVWGNGAPPELKPGDLGDE
jgi:hypothetical protein